MTRPILDPVACDALIARLGRLDPGARPRWGRMTAPQMLVHLSDQMRHTLGDSAAAPRSGPLRWPIIRHFVVHLMPWPRGVAQGPPEAFVTQPTTWAADLATFEELVARFVRQSDRVRWPEHAVFGPMGRRTWARFSYRHIDYHLRQFGV